MTRREDKQWLPDAGEPGSSAPDGFGFELDDQAWLERVRGARHAPRLGTLGDYELIAEISRGAQGIVYRARQPATNRDIALKRLVAGRFASQSARQRFTREIEAAATLSHRNIVTVYGAEVIDDQPVLAMEWIDGAPIDDWAHPVGADGPPLRARLSAFQAVCAAVQHAHQRGVIHRDLKPGNILMDREGVPRVLDFGLAKMLPASDASGAGLTLTQDFVGTLLYAAPEQVRSEHAAVDVRTDVYALGVILYQLLAGKIPHSGAVHELIDKIQRDEPLPPSRVCPGLSRELDAVVLKSLAKKADHRYQSVDALGADIRAYLAGGPVSAHPPTTLYQLRTLVRRHRPAFVLATVVATLVLAFGVVSLWQALRLETERATAERRFEQVRGISRILIHDIHDAIAPLNGALSARELIVETGLAYLDGLVEESSDDAALLMECASGYFRIAQLQGNPNAANLGQIAAALASCRKGLTIVEELRESDPSESDILLHAATGQHVYANLLTASGQTADAIAAYREALSLRATAARHDPDAADVIEIESINADLAACYERADRFAEAEDQLLLVVQSVESRIEDDPDGAEPREKLGNVLASLGHVRIQQGDADRALEALDPAIDILENAVVEHATQENLSRSLVVARTARARAVAAQGDTEAAQDELEWVIEAHTVRINADPTNVTTYHDLAAAHHFLGRLLDGRGDSAGALAQFEDMLRIRRNLADDQPSSMLAKRGVAIGLDMTGTALRKLNRLDDALERHLAAQAIFEDIATADPENPRHQRSLAVCSFYIGELHRDRARQDDSARPRDLLAARRQFARALTLMQDLEARGLILPNEASVLQTLNDHIAACDQELGHIDRNSAD